ncbi:GNAT family N-acetyltransferase [Polymorphum gilvum]|uniref:Putative acetyltransferase protein n=1 Tax=Polymorphum gilvum (strain LMG 25793 / CGMCC 1.9160 / SL003B-26A1) TaxID=991905 RepID=F2J2C0_POLGS|nr:GNAT family N-acetyltransferase [Polymorphum gilvum]ADZ69816.1 Putative acetyltransferase protein [Polymorphum gilvum SL003B-26A1]
MLETVLATERLRAVPFRQDDLPLMEALHADPEVNRYLGTAAAWDKATVRRKLDKFITDQERHGFSKWKILTRDGEFVGRAGFTPYDETSEIEMGYSFMRAHWGKGYATEISRALTRWFFDKTYYTHLIGFCRTDHRASRRVLEKAGLTYRETRSIKGMPCDVYQILSPAMQKLVSNA